MSFCGADNRLRRFSAGFGVESKAKSGYNGSYRTYREIYISQEDFMKLVDEKGRLFGKLNLIDLAVIIIVLAVVAAVGMKLFGNKAVASATTQQVTLTYEVVAQNVPDHVAEYCVAHTGGQLLSSGKLLDGYITGCEAVEVSDENGTHTDLYFTIEVNTTFSSSAYVVGSQEVRVGMEHLVKTSDIEVEGIISNLEVTSNG